MKETENKRRERKRGSAEILKRTKERERQRERVTKRERETKKEKDGKRVIKRQRIKQ